MCASTTIPNARHLPQVAVCPFKIRAQQSLYRQRDTAQKKKLACTLDGAVHGCSCSNCSIDLSVPGNTASTACRGHELHCRRVLTDPDKCHVLLSLTSNVCRFCYRVFSARTAFCRGHEEEPSYEHHGCVEYYSNGFEDTFFDLPSPAVSPAGKDRFSCWYFNDPNK